MAAVPRIHFHHILFVFRELAFWPQGSNHTGAQVSEREKSELTTIKVGCRSTIWLSVVAEC